ncbi:MAG: rhomboid family intramembrane serine protease [Planctomycetota bacterium]
MNENSDPWVVVGQARSKRALRDAELVLRSQGIPFVLEPRDGAYVLGVPHASAEVAQRELTRFATEEREHVPESVQPVQTGIYWWHGVVLYAATLILGHVFATARAFGFDWYANGSADAGRIRAGEAWRTVTSLCLHSDVPHLGSNLLYGALFGGLVAYANGGGVAFLAMLLAGALGNAINALAQDPSHLSVGASTAVFGAVGLLSGSEWRRRVLLRAGPMRRFAPVFLALALFAWLGIGENPEVQRIDVFAHAFGVLAGLGLGVALAALPDGTAKHPGVQRLAGGAALVLVAAAWAVALS